MPCKKCRHTDINTNYIPKNKKIDKCSYDDNVWEFIELEKITSSVPSAIRYIAIKEHLEMHCRNCHYSWLEDVKDAH